MVRRRHGVSKDETESLGTKNIEGIQATGTRTTDTIPAGAIGNDKDIVITHETWYAPDLKVVLKSTQGIICVLAKQHTRSRTSRGVNRRGVV